MSIEPISEAFNIPTDQLFKKSRKQNLITARFTFFTLIIIHKSMLEPRPFGFSELEKTTGFDRTTIHNSVKKVFNWYQVDINFRTKFNSLIQEQNLVTEFQYFRTIYKN